MSFPRLSENGDQELSRLLKAGRTDVPSSASKQRALAAALVGATTGSAATFAIKASLMTTPVRAWLLVGMITVGIPTAILVHQVRGASLPIAPPTPAPTSVSVAPAAPTAVESVEMPPVPTAEALKVALAPSRSRQTPRAPTAKAANAAPAETSLSSELAEVRRIKSALATDGRAALALLDAYAIQFPNPRFGEEAAVLRIEALVMVGEATRARAAAATFATQFPRSTYGARVASALSRAE